MKDRLGKARFWNLAPKNPTQTRYTRFLLGPRGKIKTSYTDSLERFEMFKRRNETIYERMFGEKL